MSLYSLRKLKDSEMVQGLSLLHENLQWLEERGIHQWSADLIKRAYPEYQKEGENFAFEHANQIVAILSIHKRAPVYWRGVLDSLDYRFISKLAVDVSLRGQGIGRLVIEEAQQLLRDEKVQELFLEVSYEEGFLIQYYKELDFVVVDRIDVDLESGAYDMILMKCALGQ